MACNFCSPHPSNDYICAGANIKWPYVAKVNMSLDKGTGLWKLEDRDDGTDTWEWVTTLKPMDVNGRSHRRTSVAAKLHPRFRSM